MNIYDRIVEVAKTKGMSINFIEEKAGVSKGSICKWNKVSPSVVTLTKVANVLGSTVEELIGEGD